MKLPSKYIITFSILLGLSLNVLAESLHSFDLNKDGSPDRFEYFENKKLIRIEEDRDGDKKIDFKTILNDKVYYKIEFQSTKGNGKFDRKKSYLLLPSNKTRVITETDKNADGVFETRYEQVVKNLQNQDACGPAVNLKIQELSTNVLKAVSKTDRGLLSTGLGYKVDHECYEKWGDGFNDIVKDVALGGLQCLKDLDTKGRDGKNISGALRNAFELTKLMKDDGISLVCSEDKDYAWSGTMAHASTAPDQKMESKNISHPFVSLNPAHPESPASDRAEEIAELKNTIFHETLHNLGYKHKEDMEFPYTCGQCCFDDNANATVKAQACKVCLGNYTNETDINYVKDFVEYSQISFQADRGPAAAEKFLKENPKSVSGISILAYAESGVFNPVGSDLTNIINENHKDLTAADKKFLADSKLYSESEDLKTAKGTSKVLAHSLYELYFNKSGINAVAALEKDKVLIKQELKALEVAGGNKKFIREDLKRVLDDLIFDMWVNEYPGDGDPEKNTSSKAYELFEYFGETP